MNTATNMREGNMTSKSSCERAYGQACIMQLTCSLKIIRAHQNWKIAKMDVCWWYGSFVQHGEGPASCGRWGDG
jgi:hypothetical protein